jgi:hypothetical protein
MRKLICVVCLCIFSGCQNPRQATYSSQEVARVGEAGERRQLKQDAEQEARDKPLADCLKIPLDTKVGDSFTVRDRLHAIGAHVVDSRTVVDRDGKVIYARPEGAENQGQMKEMIKIVAALDKYSPTPSFPPELIPK